MCWVLSDILEKSYIIKKSIQNYTNFLQMATPTETEDINDCPINKRHLNFILLIL